MNIILEGPDNTGKSTLADIIAQHVPFKVKRGEGPSKSRDEIRERSRRYLQMDNMIFDRHPCVSELIYGDFREPLTSLSSGHSIMDLFYKSRPLFIYCYGTSSGEHQLKDYDTPEHIDMINANKEGIHHAYRQWAKAHVPVKQWYSLQYPDLDGATQSIIKLCQEQTL